MSDPGVRAALLSAAIVALSFCACNAIVGVIDVTAEQADGGGTGTSDSGEPQPGDDGSVPSDDGGAQGDTGQPMRAPVVQVVGGSDHTCAKTRTGVVKCWGSNELGQAGNGIGDGGNDPPNVITPATVISLGTGVLGVGNGYNHTCAIKSDSSVACWGFNFSGQLGSSSSSYSQSSTPLPVSGVTGAVQIAGGVASTCVVLSSGAVKCWGDNAHGQLGDGDKNTTAQIVSVTGINDATEVALGDYHACAVRGAGKVSCWGMNKNGQLGVTSTADSPVPVDTSITDAVHVTAGESFTCALRSSGAVQCWGANDYGQLGNGTATSSTTATPTPQTVTGLTDAISIGAGESHACAVRKSGAVVCWGLGGDGELGTGSKPADAGGANPTPVSVVGFSNAVSVGQVLGFHACAADVNDVVLCWGTNYFGECGDDPMTTMNEYSPNGVAGFP